MIHVFFQSFNVIIGADILPAVITCTFEIFRKTPLLKTDSNLFMSRSRVSRGNDLQNRFT
ncbi:MAG: hypothetical protein BWK80_38100 [Desulfobacteraceae bacterium IS3]|nr:MAG: hypothetical protein BWK80_38100 [Desulfobacteraceae bacterium IS3]